MSKDHVVSKASKAFLINASAHARQDVSWPQALERLLLSAAATCCCCQSQQVGPAAASSSNLLLSAAAV